MRKRTQFINSMKKNGIHTVFHYLSLHSSPFYSGKYSGKELPNSDRFMQTLLRLPFYYELSLDQVNYICSKAK
jgi:dTDP-4-amino-4,6-dideoxygalactose transaminase